MVQINLFDIPIETITDLSDMEILMENKLLFSNIISEISKKICEYYDIDFKNFAGVLFLMDCLNPNFLDNYLTGIIEEDFGDGITEEEKEGCLIYSFYLNENSYAIIYDKNGSSLLIGEDSVENEIIEDLYELFLFYDNHDEYFILKNKLKQI